MPAGKLRHHLAFDKKEDLSAESPPGDGYGNTESDFEEQFRQYAEFRSISVRDQLLADREAGTGVIIAIVRYNSNSKQVTSAWRVRELDTGQIYNVRGATPDEKKRFVELQLEYGVAV